MNQENPTLLGDSRRLWNSIHEDLASRLAVSVAWHLRGSPLRDDRTVGVEDVLGEAFYRAWAGRAKVPSTDRPGTYRWLWAICLNVMREWTRRYTRRRVQQLRDGSSSSTSGQLDVVAEFTRASQRLLRQESFQRMYAILDRLPAEDAELIVMIEYDDLRPGEVAERLAISGTAVRKRLERARKRLEVVRTSLEQEQGPVALPHELSAEAPRP